MGTIELDIPRVRDGSYFPSLLEPRRRAERALLAVVQEAYVGGVSTRRVDDLVRAHGIEGISKSQVSRMCAALDAEIEAFRARSLTGEAYPYLWRDAAYVKVREAGRVVSMACLVATGVAMTGERRVLGLELSAGNDEGSAWPAFVRSLVERGLHGVRLVISDDHPGLVKAIGEQLLGSGWQRCRVHLTRNAQDLVPRSTRSMVASAVRAMEGTLEALNVGLRLSPVAYRHGLRPLLAQLAGATPRSRRSWLRSGQPSDRSPSISQGSIGRSANSLSNTPRAH